MQHAQRYILEEHIWWSRRTRKGFAQNPPPLRSSEHPKLHEIKPQAMTIRISCYFWPGAYFALRRVSWEMRKVWGLTTSRFHSVPSTVGNLFQYYEHYLMRMTSNFFFRGEPWKLRPFFQRSPRTCRETCEADGSIEFIPENGVACNTSSWMVLVWLMTCSIYMRMKCYSLAECSACSGLVSPRGDINRVTFSPFATHLDWSGLGVDISLLFSTTKVTDSNQRGEV